MGNENDKGDKNKDPAGGSKFEMNDEVKAAISAMIGEQVTGAVRRHFSNSSFKEMLGGTVKEIFEPFANELREKFKPANPEKEKEGDDKGDELSPKARALIAELQGNQEKMAKALKTATEEREAEKASAKRLRERTSITKALTDNGVTGPLADAAAVLLLTEQKRVKTLDNNEVVFTVQRGADYPEDWPVDKGVAEWLKSDQGKAFLPPREGSGAGSGRGKAGGGAGAGGNQRAELARALLGVPGAKAG